MAVDPVLAAIAKLTEGINRFTAERDAQIVAAVMSGRSMRAVARAAGLTHPTVRAIVERAS